MHAIRTRANLRGMFWTPHERYPYGHLSGTARERLRHLVFLDGRLVDSWTEPIEGTAYAAMAEELDEARRPPAWVHDAYEPPPPPYEEVLTWLDGVVGGRIALLALDDEPLQNRVGSEHADDSGVDGLLARVADDHFDQDFLAAMRVALATLRREDPDLLERAPAGEIAAGVCWLVGRANGVVGANTPVTQKVLKTTLWLSTPPLRRVPRIKTCLRSLQGRSGSRPADCPDLFELGDAAYLTAATRRRLVRLRDRALAAAQAAKADRHVRETQRPAVDSLTP